MSRQNRTQLALGILLVLIGVWFIAVRQVPILKPFSNLNLDWPFYVIGAGAILLLIGLVTDAPRMAIPAAIVAGIGGILYYQNISQDWQSWNFMWTLIPGFVGVGNILAGLFGDDTRHNIGRGINLIVISAVLFLIFAAIFNRINILGNYGAAGLLILLGLYVIGRGLMSSRRGG
jgi:peptidoglycan/LPS O-acetylase OafA/YrhL